MLTTLKPGYSIMGIRAITGRRFRFIDYLDGVVEVLDAASGDIITRLQFAALKNPDGLAEDIQEITTEFQAIGGMRALESVTLQFNYVRDADSVVVTSDEALAVESIA